jgi:AcrR family transcriptional regulator
MGRQARAEVTRQAIIAGAVDVFDRVGYSRAGITDILDRLEMTKGALYYHFDSKEAITSAIIEQGAATLRDTYVRLCQLPGPAIETVIHASLVLASRIASDAVVRFAVQFSHVVGAHDQSVVAVERSWRDPMAAQFHLALEEADLREDVDADVAAEFVAAAVLGVILTWDHTSGAAGLTARMVAIWGFLLPGLVSEEALPYLREFLAREPLRLPEPPSEAPAAAPALAGG